MRQSERGTPNKCLAIWVAMTLRLSPCVTATKASASPTPMRARTSRSMPLPTCRLPRKSCGSRRKASALVSSTVTSWPSCSSIVARAAPTRPQPMITTFISSPPVPSRVIGPGQDLFAAAGFRRQFDVQRHRARHLDYVHGENGALVAFGEGAGQGQGVQAGGGTVHGHHDVLDAERVEVQ